MSEDILEGLQFYWGERSVSYSRQNIEEMNTWKRDAWRELILRHAPDQSVLRILDVGTGPGFFAINLALSGHQVTGVDVTKEMLEYAGENARAYGADVSWVQYDGERLPFEDGSFDLVVSRNVLWNIEKPLEALQEWSRVLAFGGRILYFDANWYLYLFDEEQNVRHKAAHERYHRLYHGMQHDPLGKEKGLFLENLARELPLSREKRPQWDENAVKNTGLTLVKILPDVGGRVWETHEQVHYAATPLFMVCAEKEIPDA